MLHRSFLLPWIASLLLFLPAAGAAAAPATPPAAAARPAAILASPGANAISTPAPDTPTPTEPGRSGPPLSLTLMLVLTGCILGLVFGFIALGFVLAIANRKEGSPKGNP